MKIKKIIAVLILGVFLFGMTTTGAVAQRLQSGATVQVGNDGTVQVTFQFRDMNQAKWALQQILKMSAENIIKGYEDGSFRPNKPVTHAEAVVLTMKAAGLQDEIDSTVSDSVYLPFKDAGQIPSWARNAVVIAVEKGYLDSGSAVNFQPNKAASREWVVKLIAKALGIKPMDMALPFTDAGTISSDAKGYVAAVVYNQLISGFPDGSFQPNKPITRAEIAVMLGLSTEEIPIPGNLSCKVEGTVVKVSADVYDGTYTNIMTDVYAGDAMGTITINVKNDDDDEEEGPTGEVTYPVSKNAQIYIDGQDAGLADINAGSEAKLVVDANGMVNYIEVEPVTIKGVVQSVYGDQNSLTIIERGWQKEGGRHNGKNAEWFASQGTTYYVNDNATISVNGIAVELAQLLPRDMVRLTLGADDKVTAIKATRFIAKEDEEKEDEIENEKEEVKEKVREQMKEQMKEQMEEQYKEEEKNSEEHGEDKGEKKQQQEYKANNGQNGQQVMYGKHGEDEGEDD